MFTLIAIGLQVNEMIKVYNPIREQAEAAQKAQRAWIGPSNADFSNPPIERQETKVLVSWSDSGKETAINLIHHTMIWMPQEEALNNGVVIGAMSRFEQECLATEPADTATQVAYPIGQYALSWRIVPTKDLIEGRVILIVGGCFVYRSFGKPHHSSFCYYFKGNETDPGHFSICPVGNNAD